MAFSPILSLPILFGCRFSNSLETRSEDSYARRTNDVIITDNWSLHQQWEKLKTKYWTSLRLFGIEDLKYLLACVFDCYRKSLSQSILDQHFIFGYQKPLMHSVVSLFSPIISFQSNQFLYSKPKLLNPTFPESRGEFRFKGGSLSPPKIPLLECEPFFLKKLKFSKGFHLFPFKLILFDIILNLKWVYKVKW
jgi:hypothetical protein